MIQITLKDSMSSRWLAWGSTYGHHDDVSFNFEVVSNTTGIMVEGVTNDSNYGSETRPKNMHVTFIMRVW